MVILSVSPQDPLKYRHSSRREKTEGKKQESMCFGIKNIYVSVLLLASGLGKLLKFFKPEFPHSAEWGYQLRFLGYKSQKV